MQNTSTLMQNLTPATVSPSIEAECQTQDIRTLSIDELGAVSGGLSMPDQQVETLPVTRW